MSGWLIETLASTTALMAAVLALRLPVARLFGARTAYALWLLPALRAVLPPLPGWRTLFVPRMIVVPPQPGIHGRFELALANPAAVSGPDLVFPVVAPAEGPAPWPAHLIEHSALAAWLAGATLLLAWQLWRYRRFVSRALRGATPLGEAAGTRLLLSDGVAGPLATGILHRRILLPRDFSTRYDRDSQRLVLDHEAAHHDRGDLIANLAAVTLLAIHWWNPVAWLAHRAFRTDQELACDASVLARATLDERYRYAEAVARSAGFSTPAMAAALSPVATLKRRLRMMGQTKRSRARRAAGVVIAAGVIGTGLLASASGSARQAGTDTTVMPAPPAPPPPPPPPPASAHRLRHAPTPPVPPVPPVAPAPPAPLAADMAPVPPIPPAPLSPPPPARAAAGSSSIAADRAMAAAAEAEARAAIAQRRADIATGRAERAARQTIARVDVAALVRASLAQARAGMAEACAARGHAMPSAGRDRARLATCGGTAMSDEVRRSLVETRDELAGDTDLGSGIRARVIAELDGEIARLGAFPTR